MGAREDTYRRSLDDREGFWGEAATAIDWATEPDRVPDDSRSPFPRWFPDAALNTCWNAVDRHVAGGRAEQPALVYDSPVTQTTRMYRVLLRGAEREAGDVDAELLALVRERVGAFACYRETRVAERLPKTRSSKIPATMRSVAAGRGYAVPSTIDDPAVLGEIEEAISGRVAAPSP